VYVWKNTRLCHPLIFLAGPPSIPQDLYDAAKVDGAGPWCGFPLGDAADALADLLFPDGDVCAATFQAFDIQQVMTKGGPAYATTTLVYYVYEQSFGQGANFGRAAAAAIILFIAMLIVTAIQMFYSERKVHYDG